MLEPAPRLRGRGGGFGALFDALAGAAPAR